MKTRLGWVCAWEDGSLIGFVNVVWDGGVHAFILELRLPRTTRLQSVSRDRAHSNHLPDGTEQQARDKAYARQDPLVANGWIYAYDPDAELGDSEAAQE
ncbi:hypothetical protein [Streptomyces sp. NBC_01483]|uniref:hypothetical protein n=1 Tax=Streptomyces sp. NBC_01483 TaxID=2903883 RepID=UPI003FCD3A3C